MSVLATEPVLETRREARGPHPDPEGSLLEALRRRDPSAAEQLVARFGARAYRLAWGITRNAEDAEEAVQDAFLNVARKIDTFRGDSAFRSWIYRVVSNAAYQKVRGAAHRRAELPLDAVLPSFHEDGRHTEPVVDWSSAVDDPSRGTELRLALAAAIAELPAKYQAAVLLHDVEGLSSSEVAETLGISLGNAKTRVHRARLFLRERLAEAMTA
jgi:RNA polymerase sigma-70 factor (ECF subfamily)